MYITKDTVSNRSIKYTRRSMSFYPKAESKRRLETVVACRTGRRIVYGHNLFQEVKDQQGEKIIAQPLKDQFDYGQNPDKKQVGQLISAYEHDYMTANAEFRLSKAKYKAASGREPRREVDVPCCQICQSFKLVDITPGEANRASCETSMRQTKGC